MEERAKVRCGDGTKEEKAGTIGIAEVVSSRRRGRRRLDDSDRLRVRVVRVFLALLDDDGD